MFSVILDYLVCDLTLSRLWSRLFCRWSCTILLVIHLPMLTKCFSITVQHFDVVQNSAQHSTNSAHCNSAVYECRVPLHLYTLLVWMFLPCVAPIWGASAHQISLPLLVTLYADVVFYRLGIYYCPLLTVIVVIKLWFIFYLKRVSWSSMSVKALVEVGVAVCLASTRYAHWAQSLLRKTKGSVLYVTRTESGVLVVSFVSEWYKTEGWNWTICGHLVFSYWRLLDTIIY